MHTSSSSARNDDEVQELEAPRRSNALTAQDLKEFVHGNKTAAQQFRRWVATFNNPKFKPDELPDKLLGLDIEVKYVCWCLEKGERGTPHYQVYFDTAPKKYRFMAMRNKITRLKGWVEPCKAPDQARDYIMRLNDHAEKNGLIEGPFEYGHWDSVGQGRRSDLSEVTDMMKTGKKLAEIAAEHPSTFVRFHGGLKALEQILQVDKRWWMTELHILTGVAGSGKSYTAMKEAEQYAVNHGSTKDDVYYWTAPAKLGDKIWFNGYNGEQCVVINDFYGTMDIDTFKNMIDRYPFTVEVKNGHKQFLARAVWITSNQGWSTWWSSKLLENANNKDAIERRITSQRHFDSAWEPPNETPMLTADEIQQADRAAEDLDLLCLETFQDPRTNPVQQTLESETNFWNLD